MVRPPPSPTVTSEGTLLQKCPRSLHFHTINGVTDERGTFLTRLVVIFLPPSLIYIIWLRSRTSSMRSSSAPLPIRVPFPREKRQPCRFPASLTLACCLFCRQRLSAWGSVSKAARHLDRRPAGATLEAAAGRSATPQLGGTAAPLTASVIFTVECVGAVFRQNAPAETEASESSQKRYGRSGQKGNVASFSRGTFDKHVLMLVEP